MLPVLTLRLAALAAGGALLAPLVATRWIVLYDLALAGAAIVDWLRAPVPNRSICGGTRRTS